LKGASASVRVMTWNIHRGVGPDGRYDFPRITRLIERHAPDIIALQELDTRGILELDRQPLSILSTTFGLHSLEGRTIVAPDGHYGHALLSRWPIVDGRCIDLAVRWREPRCAIEGRIDTPIGRLAVRTVHFGLDPFERREQVRRLLAEADPSGGAAVVMGDFNDWLGRGYVRRLLGRRYGAPTTQRTFPAICPLFALDRIYCAPPLVRLGVWSDDESKYISDHLPMIADIALAGKVQ
jgi:endonuclease/exonuclease/phosphatase family metal-dependent hydrolase